MLDDDELERASTAAVDRQHDAVVRPRSAVQAGAKRAWGARPRVRPAFFGVFGSLWDVWASHAIARCEPGLECLLPIHTGEAIPSLTLRRGATS